MVVVVVDGEEANGLAVVGEGSKRVTRDITAWFAVVVISRNEVVTRSVICADILAEGLGNVPLACLRFAASYVLVVYISGWQSTWRTHCFDG